MGLGGARRRRRGPVGAGARRPPGRSACATALASPLPALFLALAAIAWALARRDPRAAWPAGGALLGVAALVVAFPEGGIEPFAASAFWPALAATVAVGLAAGPEARVLRTGVRRCTPSRWWPATCSTRRWAATRRGWARSRPARCWRGPPGGRAVAHAPPRCGALAAALAYWQWYPPVRDWARAAGDPSVEEAFHAPLLARLEAERARRGPFRVEVPFTENHWEARWIAPRFPLARGWQRQLDVERNPLFYDGRLTPARLRRWLEREAVAFVAVPRVDLDAAGRGGGRAGDRRARPGPAPRLVARPTGACTPSAGRGRWRPAPR